MCLVPDDGWVRIGRRIEAERSRRWPNRSDFAVACGVSVSWLFELEHARRTNFAQRKLSRVEAVLGWAPEAIRNAAEGGRPVRMMDPELTRIFDAWNDLSDDARKMLANLAEGRRNH
jgi:hypothetical protein